MFRNTTFMKFLNKSLLFSFSSTNKNHLKGSILHPSDCLVSLCENAGVVMSCDQYKKLFLWQGVCMTSAKLLSIPGVDSKTLFFWWEREAESLSAIFGPKATGRSAISIIDWTLLFPWHTFFPFHYMNLQGPGQRLPHEGIFPVVRTTLMWGQWFLSPQTPPPPQVSCHDGISDWRNISHCMAAD